MENNEQEQQELFFKFSMYEQQIKQLQQQLEAIERGVTELTTLNFGLDELVGAKEKEIFAPMGKGIFVKAKLISEELNVDVGEGNLVKKSIPETKELIEEQIKKLVQVKKEMENNLEELGREVMNIMNGQQEEHNCKCKEGEECSCNHDENCECE